MQLTPTLRFIHFCDGRIVIFLIDLMYCISYHQGFAVAAGFAAAAHLDATLETIARLDTANKKSSGRLFGFIKVCSYELNY